MQVIRHIKNILSFLKRPYVFICIVAVFIIFLPGLARKYELNERKNFIERETKRLYKENRDFLDKAEKLKSDPQYQERVARETLGVVKEGEIVLKIEPKE